MPTQIVFGRIAPAVFTSNFDRALAFYRDVLGMQVTFTNGDPIGFAILEREQAELHLAYVPGHRPSTANVAHLDVSDATALYEHLQAHDVRIIKALRDQEYGERSFVFADPDGNRIDVGESRGATH